MSGLDTSCSTCLTILRVLTAADETPTDDKSNKNKHPRLGIEVRVGLLPNLVNIQCSCAEIFHHLVETFEHNKWCNYEETEVYISPPRSSPSPSEAYIRAADWQGFELAISAFGTLKEPPLISRGRTIDKSWVDISTVREWLSTCRSQHGSCRTIGDPSSGLIESQPTWLIDTLDGCLIASGGVLRIYAALSYQWGDQPVRICNTRALQRSFEEHGYLHRPEVRERLAATVVHAIDLTKQLECRYLFVDSICVAQDDEALMETEIGRMHLIYAAALLTICAADGVGADHGLRGLQSISDPRSTRTHHVFRLSDDSAVIKGHFRRPNLGTRTMNNGYFSRAWTYQEYAFAKRRLVFEADRVHWECEQACWIEELLPASTFGGHIGGGTALLNNRTPNLGNLSDILADFNARQLTYPEDAYRAFAGVQTHLSGQMDSRIFQGIPEILWEQCLCWYPRHNLRRRWPASPNTSQYLPSWSWLGWAGLVQFPTDCEYESGSVVMDHVYGFIEPVAKWHSVHLGDPITRHRLRSVWSDCRARARSNHDCPVGWIRRPFNVYDDAGPIFSLGYIPREIPRWLYEVETAKSWEKAAIQHWYPITRDQNDYVESSISQSPLLQCRTRTLILRGKDLFNISRIVDDIYGTPRVRMYGAGDDLAGIVIMHNQDHVSAIQKAGPGGLQMFLIAVAEGYTTMIYTQKEAETHHFADGGPVAPARDCYFVLWIRFEDSIAYREGSGAVLKDIWDRVCSPEPVDITLG